MGFTILGAGALVSLGTYFYLDRQFEKEAEEQFYVYTNTIEDVSRMHFESTIDSIHDLGLTISAQAEHYNWTFPFVTVENWEVHARKARERGFLDSIQYAPWVEGQDNVDQFAQYVLENLQWQDDSIEMYKFFRPGTENDDFPKNANPFILQKESLDQNGHIQDIIVATGDGPFVPVYQRSPPSDLNETMIDMHSLDNGAVRIAVANKGMKTVLLLSGGISRSFLLIF